MTFAVPYLVQDVNGERRIFSDGLVKIDPNLWGADKIRLYFEIQKAGWTRSVFGTFAYVRYDETGAKYIFPGIKLKGEKASSKIDTRIEYEAAEFETYVQSVLSHAAEQKKIAEHNLDILLHDLRRLSTAIISNAELVKLAIHRNEKDVAKERIDSVIAAQHMLKIRTDLLDLAGNPDANRPIKKIPVYKKLDKVLRCFSSFAEKNGIQITLKGGCFKFIEGPDVFELVPYILVDNAIKYSPSPGEVNVDIWSTPLSTHIAFRSVGPIIDDDELEKIFSRGYRSIGALETGVQGSGLGLFLALNLVKRFGGSLTVDRSSKVYMINGLTYTDVCFEASFPSFE